MSFFIQYNDKNKPVGCSEFPLTGIDFVSKEVDEQTYNNYLSAVQTKRVTLEKIETCKTYLESTDYIVLKIAEAETEEEKQVLREKYTTELNNRKVCRNQINELEKTLNQ